MKIKIQEGDAYQHEHTAKQGIQDELQGRIVPFGSSAPEFDKKVAWDKHEFPKDEEEDQVEGEEDPHRGCFERQERHHVELHLMTNGIPGIDHDQDSEECSEPNEEHADPVNRKVVADSEGGNPRHMFRKLECSRVWNES